MIFGFGSSNGSGGPPRIAVLGGGPAGLAAAHAALSADAHVLVDVYEAGRDVGGAVMSVRDAGFLQELGPNSMNAKHADVHTLIHGDLKLGPRIVDRDTGKAKKFFIAKAGGMLALPTSLPAFLKTPLLTTAGKLRILWEPFVPKLKSLEEARGESVESFFARRFGREVADWIVDPAIAGIYSGRTDGLSMRHALARVWDIERERGSVIGGFLRPKSKPKSGDEDEPKAVSAKMLRASFSYDEGLQVLTNALVDSVTSSKRGRLRTGRPVHSLRVIDNTPEDELSGKTRRWIINGGSVKYDAVVSTIPAHAVDGIVVNEPSITAAFGEMSRRIKYAPVAVCVLAYKKVDVRHALDGFGVLIPSKEKRGGLLGVTFSTSNYPGRAERDDELYVTAYVGGNRYPEKALMPGKAVADLAAAQVESLLGAKTTKLQYSRVKTWALGIPQYAPFEFEKAKAAMDHAEIRAPGLVLAGNYRDGVGLPDALQSGLNAGMRALTSIKHQREQGEVMKLNAKPLV
jgi:protoporphyrinogen/coproporphyrinogen III oxidase